LVPAWGDGAELMRGTYEHLTSRYVKGKFRKLSFTNTPLTDPGSMKALSHPGRFKILSYLQLHGAATATECAQVAGASPSACSYHLRKLSYWGLIEEVPSDDGRERRWRALVQEFSWENGTESSDPEAAAAQLSRMVLKDAVSIIASYLAGGSGPWSRVQSSGLLVTESELDEIATNVLEIVRPYFITIREDAPPGARLVQFLAAAAPRATE
jgi:DNA-binding transcriptional ArsR family regulator